MNKRTLLALFTLVTSFLFAPSASAQVSIVDTFTTNGDYATDSAYAMNSGSDGTLSDNNGVDKPLTLSTGVLSAAGHDKLVGLLTLGDSAVACLTVASRS